MAAAAGRQRKNRRRNRDLVVVKAVLKNCILHLIRRRLEIEHHFVARSCNPVVVVGSNFGFDFQMVEHVTEMVEDIAEKVEEVEEKLLGNSKLKKALESLDDLAKEARKAEDVVHKME